MTPRLDGGIEQDGDDGDDNDDGGGGGGGGDGDDDDDDGSGDGDEDVLGNVAPDRMVILVMLMMTMATTPRRCKCW